MHTQPACIKQDNLRHVSTLSRSCFGWKIKQNHLLARKFIELLHAWYQNFAMQILEDLTKEVQVPALSKQILL